MVAGWKGGTPSSAMNTPKTYCKIQYEREIADRDRLIAKLRDQLTRALEAIAALQRCSHCGKPMPFCDCRKAM